MDIFVYVLACCNLLCRIAVLSDTSGKQKLSDDKCELMQLQ